MTGFTLRNMVAGNLRAARWDSDKVALVYGDQSRTYAQLDNGIDELAAGLSAQGFAPGDRMLVLLPNCIEYVELFFAVTSLGGVIVPTNYLLSPAEVDHVQRDSEAAWMVVHARFAEGMSQIDTGASAPRIFGVGGLPGQPALDTLRVARPGEITRVVDPSEVALLQYTSGTSGLPKAAIHTHTTLMFNSLQQMLDFGITADDTYVCVPALCWAAGFHDFTLGVLWRGGTVVLTESQGFDPQRLATGIEQHRASIVVLVPSVLRQVIDAVEADVDRLRSLRLVLVGGEAIPPELMERFQQALPEAWLSPAYGMTEGPMILSCGRSGEATPVGSSGRAMSLTDFRIADPAGNVVAPGTVGEILVQSPATMLGYHGSPEMAAAALDGGWFHTGDSGYVDELGFLFVKGRLKDMYISGGLNVYPAEAERVISLHEAVREVAVVGVPHPDLGETGRAYVVLRTGAHVGEDKLLAFARDRLANFKCPREWVLLDSPLPRTTSGKLKKSEIRAWVNPPQ